MYIVKRERRPWIDAEKFVVVVIDENGTEFSCKENLRRNSFNYNTTSIQSNIVQIFNSVSIIDSIYTTSINLQHGNTIQLSMDHQNT